MDKKVGQRQRQIAPKPLIYMNEKDWKKDWGLNPPVFPLGWPHVANSLSTGATSGATAWCAAHHVHATWMRACVRVRIRARGCTRGGLVFAWVYAWWSRVRVGVRVVVLRAA